MNPSLKTAPLIEPMTLQEAKDHLKVDLGDDDSFIIPLIVVARREAEEFMERALVTQTWEYFLDAFPGKDTTAILLPRPPLQTLTSIKYIDTDGILQTWSNTLYKVDDKREPARIVPAFNESYPDTRVEINAVTIEFIAGYGLNAQDLPEDLVHAMKLIISDRYENRGGPGDIPPAAKVILGWYRDQRF